MRRGMSQSASLILIIIILSGLIAITYAADLNSSNSVIVCPTGQFLTNQKTCATPYPRLPLTGPVLHYIASSSAHATTLLPATSILPDTSTIYYTEANDYHKAVNTATFQYSASPLTYGLIGYWPLVEGSGTSAYDLSHNNDTGTLVNSPSWVVGKFGNALQFEPNWPTLTNQYVNLGTGLQNYESGVNPISFSFWYYLPSIDSANDGYPMMFGDTNNAIRSGYNLLVTTGSTSPAGAFAFERFVNGTDTTIIGPVESIGQHYLVGSYDGTTLYMYVDGILVTTKISSGSIAPNSPMTLGDNGGTTDIGYGTIEDFRVYNYALSASQVSELYASTPPNLEHASSVSPNVYYFYPQQPSIVNSGSTYTSLGQIITATITGKYWIDIGQPVSYIVTTH